MKLFSIIIFVIVVSLISPGFAEMSIDIIVDGLNNPWEMVFASNGDIYFSERDGRIWKIEDFGEAKVIQTFPKSGAIEGGTLGLALHPNFEQNQKIYIYQTNLELEFFKNKVYSFTVNGDELKDKEIVIDEIPGAPWHDGGRIAFGPDEKLYITTGDAINPGWSQDLSSLAGKILRINPDGTIPDDNPFDSSPIFSYGHRNPQGIAWSNEGLLVSSEHGPSGEMGYGHDEINVIVKGGNYGWPKVVGDSFEGSFVNPIIHSGQSTWAPSGMVFFDSGMIPSLDGKFLVGALRGQHLMVLDIAKDGSLISAEKMFEGDFGRIRTAQISPDGVLYLLTANGDNDKIVRISEAPVEEITKFTSNESGNNQTALYVIVGVIVVGVIVVGVILKRRDN
jgi:glucose/arabinose dehydrogenase